MVSDVDGLGRIEGEGPFLFFFETWHGVGLVAQLVLERELLGYAVRLGCDGDGNGGPKIKLNLVFNSQVFLWLFKLCRNGHWNRRFQTCSEC